MRLKLDLQTLNMLQRRPKETQELETKLKLTHYLVGRIAYPVRAEATKHDKPGCKSLGCPAEKFAAVGATWEASKLGGLNIKKCLQPRELTRGKIAFADTNGKPT